MFERLADWLARALWYAYYCFEFVIRFKFTQLNNTTRHSFFTMNFQFTTSVICHHVCFDDIGFQIFVVIVVFEFWLFCCCSFVFHFHKSKHSFRLSLYHFQSFIHISRLSNHRFFFTLFFCEFILNSQFSVWCCISTPTTKRKKRTKRDKI